MCVLNFESCAIVRQRQQQTSGSATASEIHTAFRRVCFSDSLTEQLQIVFDSIEYIHYDTLVNDIPSSVVKVRATKASVNRKATQNVTHKELNLASDTANISAVSEQQATETEQNTKDDASIPSKSRPPNWALIIVIIVLSVMFWAYIRK